MYPCTEFSAQNQDLIPAPEFDVGGIFLDQKLKATFSSIDTNGDGTLDKDELHEVTILHGFWFVSKHWKTMNTTTRLL
jgi:hypothetical protein